MKTWNSEFNRNHIYNEIDFQDLKVGNLSNKLENKMNKLDFVSSPRFWQLFLIGLVVGLNFPFPNNVWIQALSAMIGVWFGGSVAVRTLDRSSDKALEGTKITAGQSTKESKVL